VAKLIENGVTGLLYEPGDVHALSAALDRLRRQPEFRKSLGRAARDAVLRNHTWDAVVERILERSRQRPEFHNRGQNLAS
jgi:glycosyltransferase involved in cell wall biosynthesis